jgi:hypothetical protein
VELGVQGGSGLVELEGGVEMEDVGGDVLREEMGDAVELERLASDKARGEGNNYFLNAAY